MAKGFSVFVNIGAKLLPSLNSSLSSVDKAFTNLNRRLKVQAAETKLAYKEMAAAAKPLAAMAAAGGLSFGLKRVIGSGAEYQHEIAALRIAGRSTQEVAAAIAQAHRTMTEVPTSTLVDNLKIINETTGAYGNFAHALENLNFNSKLGFMMTNLLGKDPGEVTHMLQAGVRALEIRGSAMDTVRYQREMSELFRAMAFFKGSGGFNTSELAAFSQTGNMPIKLYNERFLTRILPSMINELGGGDITGTQAAAFRNQIMGRVPIGGKKLTEEWVRLGLIPAPGTGGNLSRTGWTAGSVKGHALAMSDPFAWVEQVLLPAMAAKGVDINSTEAVSTQISKMFGRETAMRFVSMMADPLQRKRLHKDENLIGQALPLEDAYKLMLATDPNAAWAKVMASVTNLATILGEKVFTPELISALGTFANAVNGVAEWFNSHPMAAKFAVGAMGLGLAGALGSLFGVSLRWIFSSIFTSVGGWLLTRGLPMLGNLMLAFFRGALGRMLAGGLIRALVIGFAALATPVGWAVILAGVGAALIYYFRDDIAKWWNSTFLPWWTSAWDGVANYVKNIDWGSIGMRIADALTFGLASKINPETWGAIIKGATVGVAVGGVGGGLAGAAIGAAAGTDGKRALGGPVRAGGAYEVGERGREIFIPHTSGTIIPNGARQRGSGLTVGAINIYGATDPAEVARQVRAELNRISNQQNAYLND